MQVVNFYESVVILASDSSIRMVMSGRFILENKELFCSRGCQGGEEK